MYTHARNVGEGIRGVVVAGVHVNQTLSPTLILRQSINRSPSPPSTASFADKTRERDRTTTAPNLQLNLTTNFLAALRGGL